ncbi:MAG TPA: FHA domain-containing protein [Vicinamibacteria bacterium]|nr:FHA domain-containing protein [Vicinamibacteria bacterium]
MLPPGETCAGSTGDNDIVLPVRGVSRRHARFRLDTGGAAVEDLGSRNGLFVNGSREERASLAPGDEVRLGPVTLAVEEARPSESPTPRVVASGIAEVPVTAAMLAAGALVAQQVVGKAVRDALFLSSFGVRLLPPMIMASSLVAMAAALAFSRALAARPPAQVIPAAVAANALLLAAECVLCLFHPAAAAVALYLHLAVFGGTLVSGFWSVLGERVDPHTARSLVGRIGLGASAGGAMAGLFAWGLAGRMPIAGLVAGMAGLGLLSLVALWRVRGSAHRDEPEAAPSGDGPPRALLGLRILGEVPYLRHLALVVALGAVSEVLLDYALKAEAARAFPAASSLVAFFALFQAGIAVTTLVTQGALVRSSLESLGLAGTVALLPAAALLCGLSGALAPLLATAALARGAQSVLQGSLFRAGYELLFTALPRHRKRPTKTIVDVGFDKLGGVAGGGLALALVWLGPTPGTSRLFVWSAVCSLAALLLTRRLHGGYVAALEESLLSGAVRLDRAAVFDSTTRLTMASTGLWLEPRSSLTGALTAEPPRDGVGKAARDLASDDPARVRGVLLRPEVLDVRLASLAVPWLARDELAAEAARALKAIAPRIAGLLGDALLEPTHPAQLRRRAARLLATARGPLAVEALVRGLHDPDFEVRQACASALVRQREHADAAVPADAAHDAVARELERTDPVEPERRLDHVFHLLELALDRELLRIARRSIREGGALRGTALEYLSAVLPEPVRRGVFVLAGEAVPEKTRRPAQQLEEELLRLSRSGAPEKAR